MMRYIWLRDGGIDQKSGEPITGAYATAHVIPKSRGNIYRFDDLNLILLSFTSHTWWHAEPFASAKWFREKFPNRAIYLDNLKGLVQYKRKDYEEMIERIETKIARFGGDN